MQAGQPDENETSCTHAGNTRTLDMSSAASATACPNVLSFAIMYSTSDCVTWSAPQRILLNEAPEGSGRRRRRVQTHAFTLPSRNPNDTS
jgi:hypothetical protein